VGKEERVTVNDRRSAGTMNRLDLTKRLVGRLTNDEAIVAGIGNTNFDLAGAGQRPQNFYMLGSMGLAVPIALGVAIAQPQRQVVALEGDGSLLMNLGCLATVGLVAPKNLTIVLWDNRAYQITGNQPTATSEATDLVAVARGAGIEQSAWARDEADFERLVDRALQTDGPAFIGVRVDQSPGRARPDRDPVLLKDRFMRGIGAKQ
jgi:thiamine pyrophosphate-dependent acetolactate synthase large subunit-like protein